ncbi:MAG: phosphatidylglycerol lysyltransferase domain-containing protein [Acidobacteriota bacterium]|jgi:hypothetical protein|nr:phosphatidylglycerol lysyltransferase domain-containing protein [Acidobacteriota bacterium]
MSDFSLLGFDFSRVRPEDQEAISYFLKRYPQPLSGYTYSTLEAWRAFSSYDRNQPPPETLLIAYQPDPATPPALLQPVGDFPPSLQDRIFREAATLDYPLTFVGVTGRFMEQYPEFVSRFSVHEERSYAQYLYRTEDLAELRGRKYSKKRNLIAQARNSYVWELHSLTEELTGKCFEVLESIREQEQPLVEGMLVRELDALGTTLRNIRRLGQQGLLVTVDGRPAAFAIFEAINPTTVTVHFERALRSYKGLYQVVNQETARIVQSQGFEFINREEDVGDEGLRSAKMSYHPCELVPAWELIWNRL